MSPKPKPKPKPKHGPTIMLDAATGFAGVAPPDPAQLLQDLGGSDPRMQMLMQLMRAQQAPSNDDDMPDERDELIAELSGRLDAAEARLSKMTLIARQLHEAGRAVTRRLADIAAAVGACGLCWGEDPSCRCCRGRGRPGMVRPDPEMRAHFFGTQKPVREASNPVH